MVAYFDKKNYINYLKKATDSSEARDTLRMIKNQMEIHLNFNIEELDDYEIILHEEFEEGISKDFKITKGENKIKRPLTSTSFPTKNDVYLLDDDYGMDEIKQLNFILLGSLNDEIKTLKKLIIDDDYSFHKEKIIGQDITFDKHLNLLGLPFSTLIFVDRYLFKGSAIGGNLGLFEYNLKKIISEVYQSKNFISTLLFIYQINKEGKKNDAKYDEGPNLELLVKSINECIDVKCKKPELFFIGVPARVIDDEHDRLILSNYIRIKSGDSFVYFDSKGKKITQSTSVDHYSLVNKKYINTNEILINKLVQIAKDCRNSNTGITNIPKEKNIKHLFNFQ